MTTKIGAPELSESQADKEETANEALRRTQQGARFHVVISQTETAPPGACADEDAYIVGAGATGAWAGHDGEIASAAGTNASNGWFFEPPEDGVFAWDRDTSALYRFDGSGWITFAAGAVSGVTLEAGEDLSANMLVNVYDDGGDFKVRKADADDPDRPAHGYVKTAALTGADATVFFGGTLSGLAGLSPGFVYLSATAGGVTSTPPSSGGQLVQVVGIAVAATVIAFQPQPAILL